MEALIAVALNPAIPRRIIYKERYGNIPDGRFTVKLFEVTTYTFISMERVVFPIGLGVTTRCTEIR